MTATANGWRVLTRDQCATIDVPGGSLPVHPALAPIFLDLATRYHATVEPLEWPGCWGWADRPIRGSTVRSNHASGTAIDLNAPRHPQGTAALRNYTRPQIAAVGALLQRYHGLIVWGGTWSLPDTDGMHFELADGVSFEEVAALAATLAQHPSPTPPAPPGRPGWAGPDLTGTGPALRGQAGDSGPRVQAWQAWLADNYPAYRHTCGDLIADGEWGPVTTRWNQEFGHRSAIPSADGANIGPKLAAAYHRAGLFRNRSAAQLRAAGHIRRAGRR